MLIQHARYGACSHIGTEGERPSAGEAALIATKAQNGTARPRRADTLAHDQYMVSFGALLGCWHALVGGGPRRPQGYAAPGQPPRARFAEYLRREVAGLHRNPWALADKGEVTLRRLSVSAATVLATVAVMSNVEIVAQTLKEWSQCSAGEGKAVDVVIIACSTIIQAGQDGSRRLAMAFNNRGVAYKSRGDYHRALQDYEQALILNPNFASAYNNRGVIYGLKGDYDRAIREYGEAISLDKTFSAAFYNRAIAHLEKGNLDRALGDFATVLRFNAKSALALYGRGVVRLKNGDAENGAADIAAAKAIDFNVVEAFERSRTR